MKEVTSSSRRRPSPRKSGGRRSETDAVVDAGDGDRDVSGVAYPRLCLVDLSTCVGSSGLFGVRGDRLRSPQLGKAAMTTTDQNVISGDQLFDLHITHGFSLADSLAECKRCGFGVEWSGWFRAARAEHKRSGGWDFDAARRAIKDAVSDSGWHETETQILRSAWNSAFYAITQDATT